MRTLAVLLVVVVCVVGMTSIGCSSCDHCQNCRRCTNCRLDQPCAAARNDGDYKGSPGIHIESARYGRDDKWVDVTPQVRGLVAGDTIVFPRDLQAVFNVDPMPNKMKSVEMTIVVDGRVMEMTVGDNLNLTPLRLRAAGGGAIESGAATTRVTKAAQ